MKTGKDLVKVAMSRLGEEYILGADVPKNDPDYHGPWDCAEKISWDACQVTGQLFGCENNQGDPATENAWTGFWARDSKKLQQISIEEAAGIPGAILGRKPPEMGGEGACGHIVMSDGTGNGTIEAACHRLGVCRLHISGRRWDYAVLLPGIEYSGEVKPVTGPTGTIYRVTDSFMRGPDVLALQKALFARGYDVATDGIYGPKTAKAVHAFQVDHGGLIADGEFGPATYKALFLS